MLGSDSFPWFHRWKYAGAILKHHPIVVFMRPGDEKGSMEEHVDSLKRIYGESEGVVHILDNPRVDCSSTCLKRIFVSDDEKNLVLRRNCLPESVLNIIRENKLYMENPHSDSSGGSAECLS